MSATHRPDFEAFRKESRKHQRRPGTQFYREAYMWPQINLEDLTKTRTLLLLLNARGRCQPAEFAAADMEAMHLGLVSKAIVLPFLNHHVMMFTGRITPQTYGQLIPWDDHPDACVWLCTGKGSHPGQGLYILEAQKRLMSFLVKCAKKLLHDIPEESLLDYPVATTLALPLETDNGFDSLAVMVAEAPYRAPAQLSFARIETLLAAKRDAAADHLWALREDPKYYAETMGLSQEHRKEMLKDTYGRPHPLSISRREDIIWGQVVLNELNNAHLQLEVWAELQFQSEKLKQMQTQYANLKPTDSLPEPYMAAISVFGASSITQLEGLYIC